MRPSRIFINTGSSAFAAQRQNILNNISSNKAEANGWNALFKTIDISNVVRTNSNTITITVPALTGYDITLLETITATLPNEVLVNSTTDITGTPTFDITVVANTAIPFGHHLLDRQYAAIAAHRLGGILQ